MAIRGIRGATTVKVDEPEQVILATMELLEVIFKTNIDLQPEDIASAFFTVTDDISSVHPALAARKMGWTMVPMVCAREIPVPGSLPMCIRVLIHWNTDLDQKEIKHIYLHSATVLRPDLVNG